MSERFRVTAVCLGNICRSPMTQAVLTSYVEEAGLGDRVAVDSAGTGNWHVGDDADERALATLRSAGYDLDHAARQIHRDWFTPGHAAYGDLVLAMDSSNYADLMAMAPDATAAQQVRMLRSFDPAMAGIPDGDPELDVPDPYYGRADGFATVLEMIESASAGLVAQLPTLLTTR